MGKESLYCQEGGFSEYSYKTIGVITDGNVTGKVIEPYDSENHQSLPLYSNTSKIYFRKDTNTGRITQMRIYVDRKAVFDIEWGHEHGSFHIGDVHVHVWHKNKKGKWVGRGKGMYDARPMTADEKVKYGGLIKKADPTARF